MQISISRRQAGKNILHYVHRRKVHAGNIDILIRNILDLTSFHPKKLEIQTNAKRNPRESAILSENYIQLEILTRRNPRNSKSS